MALITVNKLNFTYPNQTDCALCDISFSVNEGEFVTIFGKSGCGKSTLLRQLKPVLSPHGMKTGTVLYRGFDIYNMTHREQSEQIGFVLQDPDSQLVTDKVWHELAFGLESLSCPTTEIRRRVSEMASYFGIQTWFHQKTSDLSGGQKQLLNLASVMVMQPKLLILDEPTAQLDPISAREFLDTLSKLNRELGTTVILSEHRLEEAVSLSDQLIAMENGKICSLGTPREVGKDLFCKGSNLFTSLPTPMQVYFAVDKNSDCPVTIREGRTWLAEKKTQGLLSDTFPVSPEKSLSKEVAVSARDVWFRYEKNTPDVVKGLSLTVNKCTFFAIVGGNGTGKSTALSLLADLRQPQRGSINVSGKVSLLPQNPQVLFTEDTVLEDLYAACGLQEREHADALLSLCGLSHLSAMHPYDISGGEQQRLALAKVLLKKPDILLLDEPTKGLDAYFKETLAEIINTLTAQGTAVIMVSHDIAFCAKYADRCAMFFDGSVTCEDTPRCFFAGNSFYTTAANRMARGLLLNAILPEDIIYACGKTPVEPKKTLENTDILKNEPPISPERPAQKPNKGHKRHAWFALLVSIVLMPATVFCGIHFFADRKYYFISLLLILETLAPFLLLFERRKPRARELVMISVLCALAVFGRAAFYMLPQFKPTLAIIIISAASLGCETGFLIGAMTGFVSNFFFGQGPWTPWQMLAFAVIGFLAGLLFHGKKTQNSSMLFCIFGGLSALLIYGGIMNPATVLTTYSAPTKAQFIAAFVSGIPFDTIHALSTALFLWVLARPLLKKLNRLRKKYGLLIH